MRRQARQPGQGRRAFSSKKAEKRQEGFERLAQKLRAAPTRGKAQLKTKDLHQKIIPRR